MVWVREFAANSSPWEDRICQLLNDCAQHTCQAFQDIYSGVCANGHVHFCVRVSEHKHLCVHVCVCMWVFVCLLVCVHKHVHACVCVCLSVCVCVCVCVFGVFVWQSHYELQVLLELTILLSVPSRIWDCRCAPSHLAVFDSLTHFQVASELQIFLSFQFSLHCFPLSCDFWQATYPPCCSSLPYKTISLLPCCIWVFNVLN